MKSIDEYTKNYEDMIGFTPAKVHQRLKLGLEVDPETLSIVEHWRMNALTPEVLDPKTVQLICFSILLIQTSAAAKNHGYAAVKAGATREELHAVAAIANVFRGIAAFNHAGEIINDIFSDESST